ncbi:MAG TPA: universal stress protein [Planctomycetes bacterium]|nr:universal stress protein [Planctomycetota bacterium]
MKTAERILIAVDDSPGSERAVNYVGRMLAGNDSARVRLFHVVEPFGPPWIAMHGDLEEDSGSAEGPEARLIEEAQRRSRPTLDKMAGVLLEAGFDPDRLETSWFTAAREDSLPTEVLELAHEQGYGTVVVSRSALPWHRELFHSHLADRLVKKGEGLAIWVVE